MSRKTSFSLETYITFATLARIERIKSSFQTAFRGVELGGAASASGSQKQQTTMVEASPAGNSTIYRWAKWLRIGKASHFKNWSWHFDAEAYRYFIPALAMSVIQSTMARRCGSLGRS